MIDCFSIKLNLFDVSRCFSIFLAVVFGPQLGRDLILILREKLYGVFSIYLLLHHVIHYIYMFRYLVYTIIYFIYRWLGWWMNWWLDNHYCLKTSLNLPNDRTFSILSEPDNNITNLSIPNPQPPVGGIPHSIASTYL